MPFARRVFLAASTALVACHPARPAVAPSGGPWQSQLGVEHPLVGRLWDVGRATYVSEDEVARRLGTARHALLGEQHDNLDHHRLQARLVAAIGVARRARVVFEMIDRDRQSDLDATALDVEAMPRVLDWAKSGWPAFSAYAPIFQAANDAHLPLVAGNLPRAEAKAIARGGLGAADPTTTARLDKSARLTDVQRVSLAEELRASHCGQLPEAMIEGMSSAQIARDAAMAEAMLGGDGGAILIAGAGHVRSDRGVPAHLAARGERGTVSLAFVEVAPGKDDPRDYAERWSVTALPFDIVWMTPRASDEDPCRLIGGRK